MVHVDKLRGAGARFAELVTCHLPGKCYFNLQRLMRSFVDGFIFLRSFSSFYSRHNNYIELATSDLSKRELWGSSGLHLSLAINGLDKAVKPTQDLVS